MTRRIVSDAERVQAEIARAKRRYDRAVKARDEHAVKAEAFAEEVATLGVLLDAYEGVLRAIGGGGEQEVAGDA